MSRIETRYGLTESTTGEILELAPLTRKPRVRAKRGTAGVPRGNKHLSDSVWFVGLLGMLIGAIGLTS